VEVGKRGDVNQHKFQALLQASFSSVQNKNSRYSLRAFSKRIGLPPSAVSEILRGKRFVSEKLAMRVLENLGEKPQNLKEIFDSAGQSLSPKYHILKSDEFALISEWQHFAILSLLEVEHFIGSAANLSTSLGISQAKVLRGLARLKRLGLAKEISPHIWKSSGKSYHSSDGISDVSIRRSHFESLELAQKSLEQHSVEARDFTSLTFRLNPKNLDKIRMLTRRFREDLCRMAETSDAENVYKLCVQIFPLGKIEKERGIA
jgi:uncharacterized protein (TIGR02147 family)